MLRISVIMVFISGLEARFNFLFYLNLPEPYFLPDNMEFLCLKC